MKLLFTSKVTFKNQDKIHSSLKGKNFCLIGFTDSAFALIEWDKRGGYVFEYYSGDPEQELEIVK